MPFAKRPEWQLPQGVSRSVWQYTQSNHIAEQYDKYFAMNRLFAFDQEVIARYLNRPGLVVDLGCGTGRVLLPLARRGFPALGVDLSLRMLQVMGRKAAGRNLRVDAIRANLVQLDCLRSDSADYCFCLFSTLGMIRPRANRQRVLAHARRILKPGGLFFVHVHSIWHNLLHPAGRRWLAAHFLKRLVTRRMECGDTYFDYRGVPGMFLHTFTQGELVRALRRAGFRLRDLIPLDAGRTRPLRFRRLFGRFRANGWIAVCR